jgi:hypothetical protein
MRVRAERAKIAGEVVIVLERRQVALRLPPRRGIRLPLGACGLPWAMTALLTWKLPTTWSQARPTCAAIPGVCWQSTTYSVVPLKANTRVLALPVSVTRNRRPGSPAMVIFFGGSYTASPACCIWLSR